jgi:hypothetical protein
MQNEIGEKNDKKQKSKEITAFTLRIAPTFMLERVPYRP